MRKGQKACFKSWTLLFLQTEMLTKRNAVDSLNE